ncbi:DNA topoisomerase IV [Zunongwangia sp.]|uniref:DNA topoisomerase IV n=1 Tax=Zunongwangia sp. TaxID=1965325 RepID=UPI003AA9159C
MKKLLAFFCLFTVLGCYQPEKNCQDYRTGTFEFKSYLNGEMVTSKFIRKDSIEVDIFQGKKDTSSVRWINDCEFILTNLNPKNRQEREPIHMRILTTSKDGYTFEYGKVGDAQKKRGSVTAVKE